MKKMNKNKNKMESEFYITKLTQTCTYNFKTNHSENYFYETSLKKEKRMKIFLFLKFFYLFLKNIYIYK